MVATFFRTVTDKNEGVPRKGRGNLVLNSRGKRHVQGQSAIPSKWHNAPKREVESCLSRRLHRVPGVGRAIDHVHRGRHIYQYPPNPYPHLACVFFSLRFVCRLLFLRLVFIIRRRKAACPPKDGHAAGSLEWRDVGHRDTHGGDVQRRALPGRDLPPRADP